MKTDLYTKTILTVIAVALCFIAIQNTGLFNSANADKSFVNKFSQVPINDDGSINVKVTADMDVNIAKIGGSSVYGELPIDLKEVNGSSINSYGLPVNIEAVNGSSIYSEIPVKIKN